MDDLYSSLKNTRSIAPIAIGTTGTGQVGKIIDRKGYIGPVLFDVVYGSITATNAVFSVVVKEGDATGALTSAADADLIGTEAGAGVGATGSRVSGISKNVAKKIGYKGGKRYCNISVKSTVTATVPVAATALQRAASQPAS